MYCAHLSVCESVNCDTVETFFGGDGARTCLNCKIEGPGKKSRSETGGRRRVRPTWSGIDGSRRQEPGEGGGGEELGGGGRGARGPQCGVLCGCRLYRRGLRGEPRAGALPDTTPALECWLCKVPRWPGWALIPCESRRGAAPELDTPPAAVRSTPAPMPPISDVGDPRPLLDTELRDVAFVMDAGRQCCCKEHVEIFNVKESERRVGRVLVVLPACGGPPARRSGAGPPLASRP